MGARTPRSIAAVDRSEVDRRPLAARRAACPPSLGERDYTTLEPGRDRFHAPFYAFPALRVCADNTHTEGLPRLALLE